MIAALCIVGAGVGVLAGGVLREVFFRRRSPTLWQRWVHARKEYEDRMCCTKCDHDFT